MPAAATIIAEGQSVSASGVVEIAGLEPNTAYRLSAVALKGNINGKVSSIEHTTSAPGVHPAVVLTPGQSTTTTLTFNAALTDPETAAYVCLEKTEGLTLPTAEEILRDGKAIAQTIIHSTRNRARNRFAFFTTIHLSFLNLLTP